MSDPNDKQKCGGTVEALTDVFAAMLGDTYHCTRVWSAWNVGTMRQDDFEPAAEGDLPRELAEAAVKNCTPRGTLDGSAAEVKRYRAMVYLNMTDDGVALADPEPRSVVLASAYDALTQQLAQLQAQYEAALRAGVVYTKQIDDLLAREKQLEGALKKFAEFPLKDFGGRNNPNHPIYGFNEWVLRVRHIDAARALLASVKS